MHRRGILGLCALGALCFAAAPRLSAQDRPFVTNLGARWGNLLEPWLLYGVPEEFLGEDQNGDGDTGDVIAHVRDLAAGTVTNLQIGGDPVRLFGEWLLVAVFEIWQGDVNGDGDADDQASFLHNLATGRTVNTRLAGGVDGIAGERAFVQVDERWQGADLNGDGDREDSVFHVFDLVTEESTNLRLEARHWWPAGDRLVLSVSEAAQGTDLNGDGDHEDWVAHVHDLAADETRNLRLGTARTLLELHEPLAGDRLVLGVEEERHGADLNDDGDREDTVFLVHDLAAGETTNLRLAGRPTLLTGDLFFVAAKEDEAERDFNGDGDTADTVAHVVDLSTLVTSNLQLAGYVSRLSGDRFVVAVSEEDEGTDLNGDGDTIDPVLHAHDLASGTSTNLGLAVAELFDFDDYALFGVPESRQGDDLNGDGDREDRVYHLHDLAAGTTQNLGLSGWFWRRTGDRLVLAVSEASQSVDLNGDGDTADEVTHVHDLATGETANLGLGGSAWSLTENGFTLSVSEEQEGRDLNSDGDVQDLVIHVHDFSSGATRNVGVAGFVESVAGTWVALNISEEAEGKDFNGDGDLLDRAAHVHDLATGRTINLGLAGGEDEVELFEDWLVYDVSELEEGEDLDGNGDLESDILHLFDLTRLAELPTFLRGDCNDDGAVDVSDAVCILNWLFLGQSAPDCAAAANANGDRKVDLTDPVAVLNYLFLAGPPPVPPFPVCGPGTLETDAGAGCATTPASCR